MQNTAFGNKKDSSPPIPPPLPPSVPNTKPKLPGPVGTTQITSIIQNSACSYFPQVFRQISYLFNENPEAVISYYKPVQPVLQEGPCCGIVALSMASQLFEGKYCTTGKILATAKSSAFSKKGEMFSVFNMAALASSVLDCKSTVVSDLSNNKNVILSSICRNCPVLIPYDADKNHEPCLNHGKNAHWALLTGVCFSVFENVSISDCDLLSDEDPHVYNAPSGLHAKRLLDSSTKTCVYAHQGKSKHLALWDFETLLSSNKNLFEITRKYNSDDMALPNDDDVLSELRDKAIMLELNDN